MKKKWLAASELLLATSIWGFGFTASMWSLMAFDPITITIIRFGGAFLVGVIFLLALPQLRPEFNRKTLLYTLLPGLALGTSLCLQTWGLEFTTATKSGFITTLYVVIVPLAEALFLRVRLPSRHFLWVSVAIVGTALMVQLHDGHLNKGDLLTFICAITSAIQIIAIGRVTKHVRSVFAFNTFQSFWAVAVSLLFLPVYGHAHASPPGIHALIGLFSLTFLSTLLAFALQVRAQRVLSPSTSSVIFLLESPFATLFAVIFLQERLTLWQSFGGLLIFYSAYQATKGAKTQSKQN